MAKISEAGNWMECVCAKNNKLTFTSVRTNANTTAEVSIDPMDGIKRRIGTKIGLVIFTKNCESGLVKLARANPSNKRSNTAAIYNENTASIKKEAISTPTDIPNTIFLQFFISYYSPPPLFFDDLYVKQNIQTYKSSKNRGGGL